MIHKIKIITLIALCIHNMLFTMEEEAIDKVKIIELISLQDKSYSHLGGVFANSENNKHLKNELNLINISENKEKEAISVLAEKIKRCIPMKLIKENNPENAAISYIAAWKETITKNTFLPKEENTIFVRSFSNEEQNTLDNELILNLFWLGQIPKYYADTEPQNHESLKKIHGIRKELFITFELERRFNNELTAMERYLEKKKAITKKQITKKILLNIKYTVIILKI